MEPGGTVQRNIPWGVLIATPLGIILLALGAWRFFLREQFSMGDAFYCLLSIVPAGILLMLFDYVLQHARIAAVLPVLLGGVLAFNSPAFDVGLGLTLIGAFAGPAVSEWFAEKKRKPSAPDKPEPS